MFVLQLRRNRLFPWLTMVCLVVWTSEALIAWWSVPHDQPAWVLACNLVVRCAPMLVLVAYLAFSPRVRRTFAGTRSPAEPDAAALAAAR